MGEFADALAQRRACRSYRTDPVDPVVLDGILAAARRGPTAGNTWGLDLVVLVGEELRLRRQGGSSD
ncbi:MAG TPA: nitroreductase family protein, partial [Microthrixaceae bacterium]|nr:nitroreductase family protein [Microthrixaceae bacterium]